MCENHQIVAILKPRTLLLFAVLWCGAAATAGASAPAAAALPAGTAAGGASLDLQNYRGRVVYLDFWASWCGPCRQSFPWMEAMKDAYARRGLAVVAVDLDEHKSDADRFLGRFHPAFHIVFDPQGSLAEEFKVHGMPTSVVFDRQGNLRFTHIGFRPADAAAYERQIEELLAEK